MNHPGVYWFTFGLAISTAWLLSSYGSVMEVCGLTVAPSRLRMLAVKATTRREARPVPPCRGIIRPTSTGLRLAPGQAPADAAASAERLRRAWGVHAVCVTTVKPGVVEPRLVGFDVLRRVRMPRKVDAGFLWVRCGQRFGADLGLGRHHAASPADRPRLPPSERRSLREWRSETSHPKRSPPSAPSPLNGPASRGR